MEKARKYSLCGLGPKRKMMLQTGTLNFRPPVSRSKSAPRLGSIDEEDEISEKPEDKEEEASIRRWIYLGYYLKLYYNNKNKRKFF